MSAKRSKALAGGIAGTALFLTLGVAAVAQIGDSGPATPAAFARAADAGAQSPAPAPTPVDAAPSEAPPTEPAPADTTTTAPAAKAKAPSTTATTKKAAAPTTTAAPVPAAPASTPTTAPPAPKLPPGQRVPYTTAAVQAAASVLTQRIPLFKPTDGQLRTFADAVCTSFDQGQTMVQVQATVRDAVSRIQGASISDADAAFAVALVVQLRCPGYLP